MTKKETPGRWPRLPPPFDLVVCQGEDAFRHAAARAAAEGDAGELSWAPRDDRLDCAIILIPERPMAAIGILRRVAALAVGDALALSAPPQRPVGMAAPGTLLVDGAVVGDVRAARIGGAVVVGVVVHVLGDDSPGAHPERTALRDEGFDAMEPADLVEGFARHLLRWLDVLEHDGAAPVERAWGARRGTPALPQGVDP